MFTFLLILIYLAFISLGLPDSLLGAAWPAMRVQLQAPVAAAGIVSMIVSGGTIVSSLVSSRIIRKLGTGRVTFISVAMTAMALLGYSVAPGLWWICIMAVPLGLGAGSVDAALNNFVALHYKAGHMSWLHCFWGIGATAGPVILSFFIAGERGWKGGFGTIAIIQIVLTVVLLFSLPLWKKAEAAPEDASAQADVHISNMAALRLPGVPLAMLAFFCYCAAELTTGLWGASYLAEIKGLPAATAARWISIYYGGITVGRMLCGFVAMRVKGRTLVRIGAVVCILGAVVLMLPLPASASLLGFILVGLGCAPIYPCMLHDTPARFGKQASQTVMGLQMAFAYTGSTFMPSILGLLASFLSMKLLPWALLLLFGVLLLLTERLNRFIKARGHDPATQQHVQP